MKVKCKRENKKTILVAKYSFKKNDSLSGNYKKEVRKRIKKIINYLKEQEGFEGEWRYNSFYTDFFEDKTKKERKAEIYFPIIKRIFKPCFNIKIISPQNLSKEEMLNLKGLEKFIFFEKTN